MPDRVIKGTTGAMAQLAPTSELSGLDIKRIFGPVLNHIPVSGLRSYGEALPPVVPVSPFRNSTSQNIEPTKGRNRAEKTAG